MINFKSKYQNSNNKNGELVFGGYGSKILIIAFYALSSACFVFAADSATMVKQGNKSYNEKKYDEALKLYNQALINSPDSPEINFNIGAAFFKKGDYQAAVSAFEKATAAKDKKLEAGASYNIANAKYKLAGLKENTDLNSAVKLMREALDYYKRAIELAPKDKDAKINHELTEKELKALLDRQKQEKSPGGQTCPTGGAGQKQEKQEGKEDQKKEQKQGGQEGEKTEENKQGEKSADKTGKEEAGKQAASQSAGGQDEAEKQAAEEAKKEKEEEGAAAAGEPLGGSKEKGQEDKQEQAEAYQATEENNKEMSQKEANMLLDGYRQEEGAFGKIDDQRQSRERTVAKDW